jgi:hypothetical protein
MSTERELLREREIGTLMATQDAMRREMTAAFDGLRGEIRAGNAEAGRRFDGIDERLDKGDAKFDAIDRRFEEDRAARQAAQLVEAEKSGRLRAYMGLGYKLSGVIGALGLMIGWVVAHHWPWLAAWLDQPPAPPPPHS